MSDTDNESNSAAVMPKLGPRSKIIIPNAFKNASTNGNGRSVGPASKEEAIHANGAGDAGQVPAEAPAKAPQAQVVAPTATEPTKLSLNPISPGLSSVKLPLGPSTKKEAESVPSEKQKVEEDGEAEAERVDKKVEASEEKVEKKVEAAEEHVKGEVEAEAEAEKAEKMVEAKVGDLVEGVVGMGLGVIGRGQVRGIREEDGILEVWAMGWEMANEQRPRFFVRKDAVKVVPTTYYKMPVLERLQIAAWLKEEGARLFKAGDYEKAAEKYMKTIGVLKTCDFKTNSYNARALELMIPCHNNAATCYIKRKQYGDARVLSENVDSLCGALERIKSGKVMKALSERGVGETTILGQWWCKGLFLGGKACLYQGEHEEAVRCLKKGSKLAKPASLAKLRTEINTELEKATKRLANQTKKAQRMWTKAFDKNSTDVASEQEEKVPSAARALPSASIPIQSVAMAGTRNGGAAKSVLERLEELSKAVTSVSAIPESGKPVAKKDELRQGEGEDSDEDDDDDEEEGDSEDDDADDDGSESLASSGLLRSSLVFVTVAAVTVAMIVALGKRR